MEGSNPGCNNTQLLFSTSRCGQAFPWTFFSHLWPRFRAFKTFRGDPQGFLLLWALTPMVFFTFSWSTVVTYVYPGLPALALLIAGALRAVPKGEPAC